LKVQGDNVSISDKNTAAIKNLAPPKNVKQLKGLISSFSYFRKFIPDFTRTMKSILDLQKGRKSGNEKIKWGKEHEEALEALKKKIIKKPVLQLDDPNKELILQTDASTKGIGAVLLQKDGDY